MDNFSIKAFQMAGNGLQDSNEGMYSLSPPASSMLRANSITASYDASPPSKTKVLQSKQAEH